MISSYEELAKYLLYIRLSPPKLKIEICVGINEDEDIADELSPDFLLQLFRLLEHKEVE